MSCNVFGGNKSTQSADIEAARKRARTLEDWATGRIADLKTFGVADCRDSEESVAQDLAMVLKGNDPALLVAALGGVARAA